MPSAHTGRTRIETDTHAQMRLLVTLVRVNRTVKGARHTMSLANSTCR